MQLQSEAGPSPSRRHRGEKWRHHRPESHPLLLRLLLIVAAPPPDGLFSPFRVSPRGALEQVCDGACDGC